MIYFTIIFNNNSINILIFPRNITKPPLSLSEKRNRLIGFSIFRGFDVGGLYLFIFLSLSSLQLWSE